MKFRRLSFVSLITVVIVSLFAIIGIVTLNAESEHEYSFFLESPLPESLIGTVLSSSDSSQFWEPSGKLNDTGIGEIDFSARGVISYDLATDRLLYSKNADERLPIASLTKIMTAVVALENNNMSDVMEVSPYASSIGENSMGLSKGEKHTLEDLLYGLILPSGNDAATVIAENSVLGSDHFVYFMNKKAEDIGLINTRFTNPSGLEGDGQQYSTARDLLVLTKYALENDDFSHIVSSVEHEIEADEDNKYYFLYNDTNLLTSYPGVRGVKTGFTHEAGMCLVTYLEYKDHKIIAVVLNSDNRRQEMKDLLDYSLTKLGIVPPLHS